VPGFLCVLRILPPIKPHPYNWNTFHYQYLIKQIQVNVPLAPLGDRTGTVLILRYVTAFAPCILYIIGNTPSLYWRKNNIEAAGIK
jgi:hypothetical protein